MHAVHIPSHTRRKTYLSAKMRISASPVRTMAALVLPPYPSPSQNAAPSATTFFSAPHSSTVADAFLTTCHVTAVCEVHPKPQRQADARRAVPYWMGVRGRG